MKSNFESLFRSAYIIPSILFIVVVVPSIIAVNIFVCEEYMARSDDHVLFKFQAENAGIQVYEELYQTTMFEAEVIYS